MVTVMLFYARGERLVYECPDATSAELREVAEDVTQGNGFIIPAGLGDVYVAPSPDLFCVEVHDDGSEDPSN